MDSLFTFIIYAMMAVIAGLYGIYWVIWIWFVYGQIKEGLSKARRPQ